MPATLSVFCSNEYSGLVDLAAWLSGNVTVSINVVTLRQNQLVPGRVTILGRVDHLGTEPATQVHSAWTIPPWVGAMSTSEIWGSVVLQCYGDQRRRMVRVAY